MGLVARSIERVGIPTVVVSLARDLTEAVGIPRALFVKWPLGHPLGEPHKPLQQRRILFDALHLLVQAAEPGVIRDLDYRWRRESYDEPDWELLAREA